MYELMVVGSVVYELSPYLHLTFVNNHVVNHLVECPRMLFFCVLAGFLRVGGQLSHFNTWTSQNAILQLPSTFALTLLSWYCVCHYVKELRPCKGNRPLRNCLTYRKLCLSWRLLPFNTLLIVCPTLSRCCWPHY